MSTLLYDITDDCNLRCSHCYNSNYFKNKKPIPGNFSKVYNQIDKRNVKHIHLLGGEPFKHTDLWNFIDYVSDDISISINTNGTYLNDDVCKMIANSMGTYVFLLWRT